MKNPVFQALANAACQGERVALAVIAGARGSSPQKTGAKALFYADGRIQGTLGGGCLEAEIQHRAIEALQTGKPATFELLLDHDFGWDDGLICGGKVAGVILPDAAAAGVPFWAALEARQSTLTWGVRPDFAIAYAPFQAGGAGDWSYVETIRPPCCLWIAGAGHIAQAVAPMAHQLDFAVTVFDDRPALANHHYFPPEITLRAAAWERLTAEPWPTEPTFGLVVTRGHRHDALVLKDWIRRPFPFIGMIGSARKARTIFDHFRAENLATPEELARVACPVGVRIRARSVPEIAVSILAQFIERRALLLEAGPETALPYSGVH